MKLHRRKDKFSAGWLMFLAGVLLGGLAGATVVWRLAPRTGKQAQSHFQKQAADECRQALENMDDVVTETDAKRPRVTDSINRGIEELQQRTQNMVNEGGK